MTPRIFTLTERPDLHGALFRIDNPWPTFMLHDPVADFYYSDGILEDFADHVLIGLEGDEVVARGFAAPFHFEGEELPDDGWDGVIRRAVLTQRSGQEPNRISALEIAIPPRWQGRGISALMVAAMRENAARHGFAELLAPVRPNGRTDVFEPMADYAFRVRDDGLPVDPWLRVHIRAGGRIEKVAPRSMVIPGTLEEWRGWTGLPFDTDGDVAVPGALAPVTVNVARGVAVYVEPNVWVRHDTALHSGDATPQAGSTS